MLVLVINCGSSSLKYQLLEMTTENLLAKGLVERIGIDGSVITHETIGKEKYVLKTPMDEQSLAIVSAWNAGLDAGAWVGSA